MKLPLNAPQLSDVRGLLERGYVSMLPDESSLAQAWLDPLVSGLLAGEAPEIGRMFVENAIQATRLTLGMNAIQTGVPVQAIGSFVSSIATAASSNDADRWVAIAEGATMATIDIAIELTGEVPVVGWAAKLALGIARLAQALAKSKTPPPPLLEYTRETDELYAKQALNILGPLAPSFDPPDWTPIFLPPAGDRFAIIDASNGFALKRIGDSGQRGGLGCLPPGRFGSRIIQARDPEGGWKLWHKKKSMTSWYNKNVFDAFVQLPGLARIGQSVWSMATSSQNSAIYNLKYLEIAGAWEYYSETALAEAQAALDFHPWGGAPPPNFPHGSSLSGQKWNSWPSFQGAAMKRGASHSNFVEGKLVKTGRTDSGPKTAGQVAKVWCELYNKRAYDMLMSHVCAYASQRQAWFQNAPGYRDRLEEARRELLQHPRVRSIDPEDCPDRNFKHALIQAGAGTGEPLKPGEVISLGGQKAVAPVRMPNTIVGYGMGGGGGLVLGAAAVAAIAGIAWKLRK